MKAVKLFCTIAIVAIAMLATKQTQAQDSKILAGAGVGYATEISSPAIFAQGVYRVTNQWEGALGISYFFPKDNGVYDLTWLGFDLNAHYVFSDSESLDFYGLAGLHITRVSASGYTYQGYSVGSVSDTSTGLNVGAGGRYQISDNLYGVGEAKYAIADGGFFQINAGVLFGF